jgi:VIT1/CCC1 family predicted Fe2+/Mn2+ transporter
MNDGVVSILALLAGVQGAGQSNHTIFITLIAATIAGAMSMGAGEFLSGKSERDYHRNEIERERVEIHLVPEVEKQEIRKIYQKKGFDGDLLEQATDQVCQDEELWVKEMVVDELDLASLEEEKLLKNVLIIFCAFILGAMFPTLPYLLLGNTLPETTTFVVSAIITFGGLFVVGALKKFITGMNWTKSGIEMVLVGAFAFGVTYVLGLLVGGAVG